ncbi:e0142a8e-ae61-4242-88df-201cb65c6cee [Sclerotinia trifoliorum]|uniref:GTP cyclohydrolase 1 n=1 Tax=Sclerotinia trifoliorum TaxID=28548 RepID=A0A8H2VMK2_9HELO|nr:e0142a8e-ae61-4242-88df-201cb65c6cee [Sclerotinia trifoliorum]
MSTNSGFANEAPRLPSKNEMEFLALLKKITIQETIDHDIIEQDTSDQALVGQSDSTQIADNQFPSSTQSEIATTVKTLLLQIGENPNREGLKKTPDRYAKALLDLTKGYKSSVEDVVNGAIFNVDTKDIVIVSDIDVSSLCEHHMLPFFGKVHIGYIPNGRVIGLSKLLRIVDIFARRLQVQERLTKQIAEAIEEVLSPLGVAVILECKHMCMMMRGVEKTGSLTSTKWMSGLLKDDLNEQRNFHTLLDRIGFLDSIAENVKRGMPHI